MEDKIKLFWIITTVVVIGFSFTSCNLGMGQDEQYVAIEGTAKVGKIIKAKTGGYGSFEGNYKWELSPTNNPYVWQEYIYFNPNVVTGTNNHIYTLVPSTFENQFVGYYIRASRRSVYSGNNGKYISSNILGPILSEN